MSVPKRRVAEAVAYLIGLFPGLVLCILIALLSFGIERLEKDAFSHSYVGAIVFAIVIGAVLRSLWTPSKRWLTGIAFSAKQLLEVAVALLGVSISFDAAVASGAMLFGTVVLTVFAALGIGFGLSRFLN